MRKLKSALSFVLAASLLVSSNLPVMAEPAAGEVVSAESAANQESNQPSGEDLGKSQDEVEAQALDATNAQPETTQTETSDNGNNEAVKKEESSGTPASGSSAETPKEETAATETTDSQKTDETNPDQASKETTSEASREETGAEATEGASESSTESSTNSATEGVTEGSAESSTQAEATPADPAEGATDTGITEEQLDTEIAAANEKIQTVDESVDVIGKPVSGGKAIDDADTFAVSLQTHISDGSFTGTGLMEQAPSITGYEFAGTVSINGTAVDRIYKELEEQTEEKTFLVNTSDGTEQTENSDGTLEPLTKEVKKTVVTSRTIVTKASNADEIITLTKQESGDVTAEFSYKKLPEEKTYAVKAHAVDEDGKTIDGHDADTLEVKDALDLTEDPIGIEGYTYKEADATIDGNDLVLASLTSEDGSYTGYTYYTDSDKKDETASAKIKADLTITLVYEKKETEKKAYKITLKTVDADGKAIGGYEDKTLPAGDTVNLTKEPFAVEGYVYDEAEIDDAVVTSITSEDGIYTFYTVKTGDRDASKVEIKSDLTIKLIYEKEKKQVKLTASLVDMEGNAIEGYENASFPKFGEDGILMLSDADNAPYDHVGHKISKTKLYKYDYRYATIEADSRNLKIKALKKENVKNGKNGKNGKKTVAVYSYTTDGSTWNEITEDATVKFVFTAGTKSFYKATSADGSITVYANLNKADAIPDDAELVVTPITASTSGYNYDAYMEALNETSDEQEAFTDRNTYLFDVAFFAHAINDNGDESGDIIEIEPAEGTVRFTVKFNDNQISNGLEANDEEDVNMMHLPLKSDVRDSVDSTKEATSITASDVAVENVDADVFIGNRDSVSFTLDSMSMLALVREPRRAAAQITDLSAYLDSVTLNDAVIKDGVYQVYEGEDYTFSVHFKETPEGQQFPDEGNMTYTLPAGITVQDITTPQYIDISGSDSQGPYIARGKYTIQKGVICFEWSEDTEDAKKALARLKDAKNAEFNLNIGASFQSNTTKIDWKTGVETTVNVITEGKVTSTKSITYYDKNNNELHYKLTVTSEGYNSNAKVTDTLNSDYLYYDGNAVTIQSSDSSHTFVAVQPPTTDKKFVQELGNLKNGETVTIDYACKIDQSKVTLDSDGNLKIDKDANKVSSESNKGKEQEHGGNDDFTIDMNPTISKTGPSALTDDDGDGFVTVPWTIVYNADGVLSMNGKTITDTIKSESFGRMNYQGDVTVNKYKGAISVSDGKVQSRSDWKEVSPASTETFKPDSSKQSWSFKINDTQPYSYVFTYHTKVKVDDLVANTSVSNGVSDGKNSKEAGSRVGPGTDNTAEIEKQATVVTDQYIQWQIKLIVPKNGLSEAVITDTFPSLNSKNYYDYLSSDSDAISVSGLLSGESYEVKKANDLHSVDITFYKDEAKTKQGLNGGTDQRNVTVTVKTTVDQDWLAFAQQYNWAQNHQNTAELNHNSNLRVTADAAPSKKDIKKTSDAGKNTTVAVTDSAGNNIELPAYYFHVVLTGVSVDENNNFTFTDVYPSSLALNRTINDNDANKVKGGNQYYQDPKNDYGKITNVSETTNYETNQTTATITVHLNGDPSKYTNYGIGYYLQVKDVGTLKSLGEQASGKENNGVLTLTNTAHYGDSSSDANCTFTANPITKEAADAKLEDDGYYYANYTITLNPTGATLNGGKPLTLTDSFTNQSVDYLGLTITTVPANAQVTYDFSGNTGTFTIPDSTKVTIRYRARIIGTGSVTYTNKAVFAGYQAETSKTADIHTSGSGSASNLFIKLLKYESGNMTNGLSGAQFTLYKASDLNKPLKKFTTGSDGTVIIEGTKDDKFTLIKGTEYVLKEVGAPTGYELAPTGYQFTIGDQADYDHYIFVNGDTLKVSDQKKQGKITIRKIIENSTENDADREFKFKIMVYDSAFKGEHNDGVNFTVNEATGESAGYVTVKKGNTVTINGIPIGTQYKVEEVLTDEQKQMYQPQISDNATGTIQMGKDGNPETVSVTATNKHLRGELEISKKTIVNEVEKVTDDVFPITIKLTDADGRTVSGNFKAQIPEGSAEQTVTFNKEGTLNLNIKSGETILLTNLPAGAAYYVSETNPGNYQESADQEEGKSGTVTTAKTAFAKLVNIKKIETGKLTIEKTVISDSETDKQKEFSFNIKLTGSADSPITQETARTYSSTISDNSKSTKSNIEFTYNETDHSLSATVSLKNGETRSIDGLPEGWKYTVTEQKADGFVTTYGTTGNSGSIVSTEGGSRVEYTNTRVSGLAITKVVNGTSGNKNYKFSFTITLKNVDAAPENSGLEFTYNSESKTAKANFTLSDGETRQIQGLKAGTEFTVMEDKSGEAEPYETTYAYSGTIKENKDNSDNVYVIESNDVNTLTVTNTKNMYGGVVIKKVVAGNDPDKKSWFAVKISLSDKTITGQYGEVYFVNGESFGRTSAGSVADYDTKGGAYYNDIYKGKVQAGYIVVRPQEGTTNVQNADPIVIWGLPEGVSYTVSEDDYSVTYDSTIYKGNDVIVKGIEKGTFEPGKTEVPSNAQTLAEKAGNIVTVTNTRNRYGKLRIEKHVLDKDGKEVTDANQDFNFKITLKNPDDSPVNGPFNDGTVNFKNGIAYVTVHAGSYLEITGLPLRAEFKVEELDENGNLLAEGKGLTGYDAPKYELWYADPESGSAQVKRSDASNGTIDVKERTVKVSNRQTTISVKFQKQWDNGNSAGAEAPAGASIVFTLYKNGVSTGRNITLDGTPDSDGETEAWTADFGYLPEYSYTASGVSRNTYTVRETTTCPGYVPTKGEGTTIVNKITSVKFRKVDEAGNRVSGAHLQIKNGDKVVAEWDTTDQDYEVKGLSTGISYTLHESSAPTGYRLAEDGVFELKADGTTDTANTTVAVTKNGTAEILTVTDQKQIQLLKVDDARNPLSGAAFEITDSSNATVETWTSDNTAHVIKARLSAGTYTLKETSAPAGYSKISNTVFTIDADGSISKLSGDTNVTIGNVEGSKAYLITVKDTYTSSGSAAISGTKVLTTKGKSGVGRKLVAGEFTFGLYGSDGTTPVTNEKGEAVTAANDAEGVFRFPAINYTQADIDDNKTGEKAYVVKEIIPEGATQNSDGTYTANGVTYDNTVYRVTVNLTDDGKGKITADISYKKGEEEARSVIFNNRYESKGQTKITAKKNLVGRTLTDKEFTFELTDGENKPKAQNDASGNVVFSGFNYTQDDITQWNPDGTGTGSKTYTLLREVIPDGDKRENGITYDESQFTVTVHLADDGKGTITATPVYTKNGGQVKEAVFNNIYTAEGDLILQGSKILNNKQIQAGEFSFGIYDDKGNLVKDRNGENCVASNDESGTFIFNPLHYVKSGEKDDIGSHNYIIKEIIPADAVKDPQTNAYVYNGIRYDSTQYQITVDVTDQGDGHLVISSSAKDGSDNQVSAICFNNTYSSNGSVTISAEKQLTGRKLTKDDFQFVLKDAENKAVASAQNDENGNITFKQIDYTDKDIAKWNADGTGTGQKIYTIREVAGNDSKVTYDKTVYQVVVTLRDDGKGKISAVPKIKNIDGSDAANNTAIFQNSYAASGSLELHGQKRLSGRTLRQGEFTFELLDANGSPVKDAGGKDITAVNDADGKFKFAPLTYTYEDYCKSTTYEYKVREKNTGEAGITYVSDSVSVEVTLTLQDDGTITATPDIGTKENPVSFNNSYQSNGSIRFAAHKNLTGRKLKANEFSFKVKEVGDDGKESVIAETNNRQNGDINFDAIHYTQADITTWSQDETGTGSKTYKISEVIPAEENERLKGVNYDPSVYTVTVALSDDGKGKIDAEITNIKKGNEQVDSAETIVFSNTYQSETTLQFAAGRKQIRGRNWTKDDSYTFKIKDQSGKDITVVHGSGADAAASTEKTVEVQNSRTDRSIQFPVIKYTNDDIARRDANGLGYGEKNYTITEVHEGCTKNADGTYQKNGVVYDSRTYSVKVLLRDDGKGTLTAEPSYSVDGSNVNNISFINTYKPSGKTDISGEKSLEGREIRDGEFTFVLEDDSGKILQETTNKGSSFTFSDITFDENDITDKHNGTGKKIFKVSEKKNDADSSITYDEKVYTVTFALTDDGKGNINAVPSYKSGEVTFDSIKFDNKYQSKGTVTISGIKEMEGRELKENEFTFILRDEEGKEYQAQNRADGSFAFDTINYTQRDITAWDNGVGTGSKEYTVIEKTGEDKNILYDSGEFKVTVALTDDGKGNITAVPSFKKGEASVDSIRFRNKYVPDTIQTSVRKVWNDSDDADGIRPDEITVQLYANGAASGDAVKLNNSNGWSYTWKDLAKKSGDKDITYTLQEVDVPSGYTVSYSGSAESGFMITNTHTPTPVVETVPVSVTKVWNDSENRMNRRPVSIQVQLYADGVAQGSPVTLNEGNGWKYTWTDLAKKNGESEIGYSVAEVAVPEGYTSEVTGDMWAGFTITNTLNETEYPKTSISGTKVWDDSSNRYDSRPDHITVNLLANGEVIATQEVGGSGDTWNFSFDGLPTVRDGQQISYSISEVPVEFYNTSVDGTTITNTLDFPALYGSWSEEEKQRYLLGDLNGVKTGDDTPLIRDFLMMAAAAAALATVIVMRRKRDKKENSKEK